MYDQCRCSADHAEMKVTLARIDEKVTTLVMNENDHERRIRRLEQWRNVLAGGIATIGALFGVNHG